MFTRIVGILGWLGTALVFAAVAARFLRADQPELSRYLALSGLAMVVLYLAGQWREIAGAFRGRQARYGTLSASSVVILLGILIAVNYIANRQNKRWDLTANQQFSLSDQTTKILASLQEPVQIKVFTRDEMFPEFRDRLSEYEYGSSQVSVEYIDVDREPARAREYEIDTLGTIVVEHAGRRERTTMNTEQDITNALLKAVEGEQKKVYFVQGHGEKDPNDADQRRGYSSARSALERDNLSADTLVLAQQATVPDDAAVVVVAGPATDYFPAEVDALRSYLARGGKLLLMLDPPDQSDSPPLTNLEALADEWGVEMGRNIVVDVSGMGQLLGTGPSVPVAATYGTHPITERFNLLTAFPLARSVQPVSGGRNGRTATSFVETSQRSWAESDIGAIMRGEEIALDEDAGDIPGPVTIGAAVTASVETPTPAPGDEETTSEEKGPGEQAPDTPQKQTRVAILGDSDFASNAALGVQGNRDLFLNTVNWLAQQESLISIRPRDPQERRVTLTADQQRRLGWLTVLMLPAAVFGLGVYTWWARRG